MPVGFLGDLSGSRIRRARAGRRERLDRYVRRRVAGGAHHGLAEHGPERRVLEAGERVERGCPHARVAVGQGGIHDRPGGADRVGRLQAVQYLAPDEGVRIGGELSRAAEDHSGAREESDSAAAPRRNGSGELTAASTTGSACCATEP